LASQPGMDINYCDENGMTPLHWAVAVGNINSVSLLLQNRQVNINQQDFLGCSALHYAANSGNYNLTALLCQHKEIDVNLKNNSRQRPVDVSQEKEVVGLLRYASKKKNLAKEHKGSLKIVDNPLFKKAPEFSTSSVLTTIKQVSMHELKE